MIYNVKIDAFEGPLDLLLHLIHTLEIDIYDIPVAEITEQYLSYIHTMKKLELDVASEYLVMAATLLAIKSKMLLPKHEPEFEEEDLKTMEEERSLMFSKPPTDLTYLMKDLMPQKLDLNVSLYDMLGAYHKLLRRKKFQKPLNTKVARQEISIEKRMSEVLDHVRSIKGRVSFESLFPFYDREHIVITFLAILELLKRNAILVEQENNFAELFIAGKEGASSIE